MSVEATTEHLGALAAARRTADDEIQRAISSLRAAYKHVVDAAEHTTALNRDTKPSGPMEELADYLADARQTLAELTLVLIDLHPKDAGTLGEHPRITTFSEDARNGMQSKRLGKWETESLRELVVEALAGEAKAPQ